jgi:RNase adapter protein RapZ
VTARDTRVVFVAGLSGSGRSTAMHALDDAGFYSVDNLPPTLVEQFLDLCAKSDPPRRKIALAIETREASFLAGIPRVVEKLRSEGAQVQLLFLECSNESLVNRYRETRRVHPLSPQGSVEEGIERERGLLEELAGLADFVIDSTGMNVHQLRDAVLRWAVGGARPTLVNLTSFGFRRGTPVHAELLFDVRFLPNPHFEPRLRPRTGLDPEVADFVLRGEAAAGLMTRLRDLLAFLLPLYDAEGKAYISVAVGCTGGQHRSVAVVEALARELRAAGREVNTTHRDAGKGD